MNGCLIRGTPIAVDCWNIRKIPQATVFFLTHLHGDHISGLTSTWNFPIYCSEITGKLLHSRLGVKNELIKSLELWRSYIIPLNSDTEETITVTLIDADHCPGSVMLFLEGYFGSILHTGDFRWSHQLKMDIQNTLGGKISQVDTLYLDNTYCDPRCDFPSREVALQSIFSIIQSNSNKLVLIACRNLGKEDMLIKIAKQFQEIISVPGLMYRTLGLLNAPDIFCNETSENASNCRIRVTEFNRTKKAHAEANAKNSPTISIIPSALYHNICVNPYRNYPGIFLVPYSDHCSYPELMDFVSYVRPKTITPIVDYKTKGPFGIDFSGRANMNCFTRYLSGFPNLVPNIPNGLKSNPFGTYRTEPKDPPKCFSQSLCTNTFRKRPKKYAVCLKRRKFLKGVNFEESEDMCSPVNSENSLPVQNGNISAPTVNIDSVLKPDTGLFTLQKGDITSNHKHHFELPPDPVSEHLVIKPLCHSLEESLSVRKSFACSGGSASSPESKNREATNSFPLTPSADITFVDSCSLTSSAKDSEFRKEHSETTVSSQCVENLETDGVPPDKSETIFSKTIVYSREIINPCPVPRRQFVQKIPCTPELVGKNQKDIPHNFKTILLDSPHECGIEIQNLSTDATLCIINEGRGTQLSPSVRVKPLSLNSERNHIRNKSVSLYSKLQKLL